MRSRVSLRIGLAVGALVLTIAFSQWLAFRGTVELYGSELRQRLVGPAVALAIATARAGRPDEASLRRDLGGVEGFSVAFYDEEGQLLARSRDDVPEVRARLTAEMRARADRSRGGGVAIGSPWLEAPSELAARVPGGGEVAYVGIFEHGALATLSAMRLRWLGAIFMVLTLVALGVTALISRRIRRSIQDAQGVVHAIAGGALDRRLPAAGDDELGVLVADFNRMADRVQQLIDELRGEEARKRALFAAFTHEINTPLTSVLGYLESLRMDDVDADPEMRRRYVRVAHEQALALDALADDLDTLSRIEHEGLSIERVPQELAALARGEIEALAPRAEAACVRVEPSGGPVVASVDRLRIAQVIRNLLDNAIRHSRRGGVVRVEVARDARGDATVVVRDEGEGIAEEHLARLGEPLFRVDPSRARGTGGRGLGLAIAIGIAHAHGGTLEIRSRLGEGTTATLVLPREFSLTEGA